MLKNINIKIILMHASISISMIGLYVIYNGGWIALMLAFGALWYFIYCFRLLAKKANSKTALIFFIGATPFILFVINLFILKNVAAIYHSNIKYFFRKDELLEEVRIAKMKDSTVSEIQWKLDNDEHGPIIIYSEKKIEVDIETTHMDKLNVNPVVNCPGILHKLDKNFYVFLNECY